MNNITEFLKKLTKNGNASLFIKINDTKYISYTILIQDTGEIIANAVEVKYTEPLFDENGRINKNAKSTYAISLDEPDNKFIYITLAKAIASNYQNENVIIKSNNLKFDYSLFSFNYFYEIAIRMMMISNHDLVCSNCINGHKYLDKYLNNMCRYLPKDSKKYSLEEVEMMEKQLTDRVIAIDKIANELKTLSGSEYYDRAFKWIDLYDDRKQQSIKSLGLK